MLLICVCYNANDDLECYLGSIANAVKLAEGVKLDVVVADNSDRTNCRQLVAEFSSDKVGNLRIYYVKSANVGYFPGVSAGAAGAGLNPGEYDYVVVSNVDLELASNFFSELFLLSLPADTGVVAPAII